MNRTPRGQGFLRRSRASRKLSRIKDRGEPRNRLSALSDTKVRR